MAKIKKYTIDDDIPANVKAGNFLGKGVDIYRDQSGKEVGHVDYFYFLVEEEEEVEPTHILLKCPHCSRDYQSKI